MPATNFGIDSDRVLAVDGFLGALRRRLDGRFAVDEFGGDPHLMDLIAPLTAPIRVEVEHGDHLPHSGAALLVSNRGVGLLGPFVLGRAVRLTVGRRLRVAGAPEVPVIGPLARKFGSVGYRPADVAALLRAGHLAAAPLGPTWFRSGLGEPPRELVAATLGFPVVPIAIKPGGPASLPIRPWRVVVGAPLITPSGAYADDHLAAAELAEDVRRAVRALLEGA